MTVAPPPDVSVIVPCRGHAAVLRRCLASIFEQRSRVTFEVVVVDAAADAEVAEVAGEFPDVRLVRSAAGLRPGAARNLGVQSARAPVLLFIDADCSAEVGWIDAAADAIGRGARAVGGPVLDGLAWHPVALADNLLQFSDLSSRRPRGPVALVPSCNLALRREEFDAAGGFPATVAGEDVLLCVALARRGPRPAEFEPRMQVRHYGRTGLAEFWRHQRTFGRARGELGLALTAAQRRLGRHAILAPAVCAKRLAYLSGRAVTAGPVAVCRFVLLLPLVAFGLVAWSYGFWQGCRLPSPAGAHRAGN